VNNKDLERYYDNFFELFNLDGWKQLQEQLETTATQINDIRAIKDPRDLDFRQGQLDALRTLLNFEDSIRQTVVALEVEERDF
jgi:hypothetical protein